MKSQLENRTYFVGNLCVPKLLELGYRYNDTFSPAYEKEIKSGYIKGLFVDYITFGYISIYIKDMILKVIYTNTIISEKEEFERLVERELIKLAKEGII